MLSCVFKTAWFSLDTSLALNFSTSPSRLLHSLPAYTCSVLEFAAVKSTPVLPASKAKAPQVLARASAPTTAAHPPPAAKFAARPPSVPGVVTFLPKSAAPAASIVQHSSSILNVCI